MNKKTAALLILLMAVLALCYGIACAGAALESGYKGLVQIRLADNPLSADTVADLIEGKEGEQTYTAWTQRDNVTVKNERLSRSYSTSVLYYCGENSRRFGLIKENGCAVSSETAFALWGTAQAQGSYLQLGEKTYVVEKVMEKDGWQEKWAGGVVIARWDSQDEAAVFDVLDIDLSREPGNFSAEELILAGGLKYTAIIAYDRFIEMFRAMTTLPIWAIALFCAWWLGGAARRNGHNLKNAGFFEQDFMLTAEMEKKKRTQWMSALGKTLIPALAAVAVILLAAVCVGLPFVIPQSWIPSRWSDFSFWSYTAESSAETLRALLTLRLYGPDVYFKVRFIGIMLLIALQTVCLTLAVTRVKKVAEGRNSSVIDLIKQHCKKI